MVRLHRPVAKLTSSPLTQSHGTNPPTTSGITAPNLHTRQQVTNNDSAACPDTLSGGAIAGIVIGSVLGSLLLLWLIRCAIDINSGGYESHYERPRRHTSSSSSYYREKPVTVTRTKSSSRRHHRDVERPGKVYVSGGSNY
ncbi:hypothetical protein AJ80_00470 [Polytolypa hystricis UAMH7299]|uniref:Uncharacterized protein n=1 Tax=Polytolypa hystricis (strain UAMH7299) TaxID=1447883 RepID=A0A2B7Z3D7_POLH7|nr:hypothetical protein AJ80_00470 [Polytolypa hystricis UAMH7299]